MKSSFKWMLASLAIVAGWCLSLGATAWAGSPEGMRL